MSDDRRRHESSRRRSRSRSPQGRYRDRAGDRDRDRRSHYKNDRRDPNDWSGKFGRVEFFNYPQRGTM